MIGNHGMVSIAEATAKGQAGSLDLPSLYASMKRGATTPRANGGRVATANWTKQGYIPLEVAKEAASYTLAFAFDDAAVATVADAVGAHADAAVFRNRSKAAYKHLWASRQQLMCPRSVAKGLECPLDPVLPYPFETLYTEGDALQWLWFVPHDVPGLVDLFPSSSTFVHKLDKFFLDARSPAQGGKWEFGTVLANAWYWAGNEPDILAPWLFNFAGNGSFQNYTAFWTRWLVDNTYNLEAGGIPGNDDFGTLSSWLLWAMVGLYPLAGTSTFVVGAPRFEALRIARPSLPKDLCVLAHNVEVDGNIYVQRVELDGVPLKTPFVDFALLGGGSPGSGNESRSGSAGQPRDDSDCVNLEFWMGADATGPWN